MRRAGRKKSGGIIWVWLPRGAKGTIASNGIASNGILPYGFELLREGRGLARRMDAHLTVLSALPLNPEEERLLEEWEVSRTLVLGKALPPHPEITGGRSPFLPLLEQEAPRLVLLPDDSTGKVVAPLLADELKARLVTAATGITAGPSDLVIAHPILKNRREALVTFPLADSLDKPLVVTLIPGSIGNESPRGGGMEITGDKEAHPRGREQEALEALNALEAEPSQPRLIPPDPRTLDLADAERIVAFGRGAFSPEAIALVKKLADALGAVVAGSRPAADEGWLPFSRQIGLTGAVVQPRLYVAVGISGAPYHMVGIKDPEVLIAINSDPDAPIFSHADLGLVGDLHRVLPALLDQLERGGGMGVPNGKKAKEGMG